MTDQHTVDALNTALADRYLVDREIGSGGMATVYLATEVKHRRRVAIKVLRPELAAVIGAERFVREIETISTLQHPHILGLIDSGEVNGTAYYVMPFIEGESLRDRLARDKQLPVDEAVRLATEVAGALDYAHRHGVIHRDIKPENILLHDGQALVADFGIALAASTASTRMTETGMSLGTPHYMSPEQAMGERELSPRCDIYALGCVVYEMLIGEPPFTGATAQAIVSRVLTDAPRPIALQRKSVPAHVEAAVLRALEKLPADRFGSAREFADALNGKSATTIAAMAAPKRREARRTVRWLAAAVAVGATLGALAYASVARFGGQAPPIVWSGELLGGSPTATGARLSPDGQMIAFEAMIDGQTQVAVLKPSSGDWAVLTTDRTRGIAWELAWSRDGSKIYFTRHHGVPLGIWSISPLGGEPRLVLENAGNPDPMADGSILVSRLNAARRAQIYRFRPDKNQLDTLNASCNFVWSGCRFRASPDGQRVAYFGRPDTDTAAVEQMYMLDLATGQSHVLHSRSVLIAGVAFSPDGEWVVSNSRKGDLLEYVAIAADGSGRERHLYSAIGSTWSTIDVGPDGSLYTTATATRLEAHRFSPLTGRLVRAIVGNGHSHILPLPDGRLLMRVTSAGRPRLMIVGGEGGDRPFAATDEGHGFPMAMLGRDAVVFLIFKNGRAVEIAVAQVETGRIVARFPIADVTFVAGTPDGRTIFYVKDAQIWRMPVGGGPPQKFTTGTGFAIDPHGQFAIVERLDGDAVHLFRVPLTGGTEEKLQIRSDLRLVPGGLQAGAVGPDGRIVLSVSTPASWSWPAAILDPATGKLELTMTDPTYDTSSNWAADGSIVTGAAALEAHNWRLKPDSGSKWWK